MSNILQLGLRGLALLWTLLITALIGNVIALNINGASSANAAINFAMFTAAWAWIALLVGIAAVFISFLASPYVMLPLDILAVLFTFIAAVVLSAKLRATNCGNINANHLPSNWIAFGAKDTEKRCREIQASTVFMWFLWACFVACLAFTVITSRGGSGGLGGRFRGGSRPSMSQVRA